MIKRIKQANEYYYNVSDLEDVFFYTLYSFKAFWIAGVVSERMQKKIKNELGINVKGYKIEINGNALRHIFYRHFNEKRKNQRNISIKDLKKVLSIVNQSQEISFGNGLDRILFKKQFPDGLYHFVVTVDNKKKILSGKSFWIKA